MDEKTDSVMAHQVERLPESIQSGDEKGNAQSHAILGEPGVWEARVDEAEAANIREHAMGVREALRAYPWAVFWSLVVSMSIIMEG